MTELIATMRRIDTDRGAIRVEDLFDTGIDDLWSAVTEPDRLARWLATVDGAPGVGRTVNASFTSSWSGPIRVDVCEAPTRLALTMEPDTEDETVVVAELTAEGACTRLVVEERGLPLADLPGHGAGWQAHLEDLGRHLAGQGSNWKPRWQQLTPSYRTLEVRSA